jgi:hypothetical protein
MSDNLDTNPILIDPNSVPGQFAALGRYVLTAVGAFALGRAWISNDALQLLTVAAPTIYGVWKTWHSKEKLVEVASAAPDSVAGVKGSVEHASEGPISPG